MRKIGSSDFFQISLAHSMIEKAQKAYISELKNHIHNMNSKTVYIDKFPLYLLKAQFISTLFPNAKFILSIRHPMDVILSCWMQNFKPNAAMANMVHLDRIVELFI